MYYSHLPQCMFYALRIWDVGIVKTASWSGACAFDFQGWRCAVTPLQEISHIWRHRTKRRAGRPCKCQNRHALIPARPLQKWREHLPAKYGDDISDMKMSLSVTRRALTWAQWWPIVFFFLPYMLSHQFESLIKLGTLFVHRRYGITLQEWVPILCSKMCITYHVIHGMLNTDESLASWLKPCKGNLVYLWAYFPHDYQCWSKIGDQRWYRSNRHIPRAEPLNSHLWLKAVKIV